MAHSDRHTYGNHIVCDLTNFGRAVDGILSDMQMQMRDALNKGIRQTAKEVKEKTRDAGSFQNRRPKYRKSIAYRFSASGYVAEAQIYARGHEYSLTHLLENGHRLWQSPGKRTRAFKHWKIGEEWGVRNVERIVLSHLRF